jgi:hypothetical protein
MDFLRKEFVRAHTVLTRFSQQPVSALLSPNGVSVLGKFIKDYTVLVVLVALYSLEIISSIISL